MRADYKVPRWVKKKIENEIDIDNIEELDTYETVETYDWQDVDTNRITINELVQAVKQLDKKIREE